MEQEMTFQDVIDAVKKEGEQDRAEIKNQGQLDRNSGAHSIKSQKKILVDGFNKLDVVFNSIGLALGRQVDALNEANRLQKEQIADQAREDRINDDDQKSVGLIIMERMKKWFEGSFLGKMQQTLMGGFSILKEGTKQGLSLFGKVAKIGVIGVIGAKFIQGLLDELTDGKFSENLGMLWTTLGNWADTLKNAGEFFGSKWEAFADKFPWLADKLETFGLALGALAVTMAMPLGIGKLARGFGRLATKLAFKGVLMGGLTALGKVLSYGPKALVAVIAGAATAIGGATHAVKGYLTDAEAERAKARSNAPGVDKPATPTTTTTEPRVETSPVNSPVVDTETKLDDKEIGKLAGKYMGQIVGKSIPLAEWAVGLGLMARHMWHGEWAGAGMEAGLMIGAGPSGIAGDVSKAVAYDLPHDIYKSMYGTSYAQDESPDRDERWEIAKAEAIKVGERIMKMMNESNADRQLGEIRSLRSQLKDLDPGSASAIQIERLLTAKERKYDYETQGSYRMQEFNQMVADEDRAMAVPVPRNEAYLSRLGSVARMSESQKVPPTVINQDNRNMSTTVVQQGKGETNGVISSYIQKASSLWGTQATNQ